MKTKRACHYDTPHAPHVHISLTLEITLQWLSSPGALASLTGARENAALLIVLVVITARARIVLRREKSRRQCLTARSPRATHRVIICGTVCGTRVQYAGELLHECVCFCVRIVCAPSSGPPLHNAARSPPV